MLKNKTISMILCFTTILCVACTQPSFAQNFASNGDSASAKPEVTPDVIKASDNSENKVEATPDAEKTTNSGDYLASRFSRSEGDIDSATRDLLTVYKKNPNETEIGNQLLGLYLQDGKVDKAMEIAMKLAKTNPKSAIPALMLSLQSIKNNDIPAAAKALNAVLAEEGGQLWLPLVSGWLDAEQHKLKTPLTLEELSAEVGQTAPIVSYNLALINAKAGFTDEAAEDFKQAIASTPKHPPLRVMQMLLQFYARNNSPEALKSIVSDYLAENPNAKDFGAKISKTSFISSANDGVAEVLYTMGAIMLAGDVAQEATIYLQLALYLRPDLESATLTLAEAYRDLNQYNTAIDLLAKIPKTSAFYPVAELYSATNLAALKKYDTAMEKLNTLIAANPTNLETYMAKGDVLREQNKFAEAASVYETAGANIKQKEARNWPIFFALANCYDRLGQWELAEKNLKFALDLSSEQPDVLNYYGYSLLVRGEKISVAKRYIEKAVQIRPEDPQIMDSMGWVLYLTGDYANAATYLEGAVSLLPADATVNEHLGDVYYRLGRKTEAKFQWERVLTYTNDGSVLQEIRKKLKDGLPEATAENTQKSIKSASIK